jgi:hypothetical protein
MLELGGAALRYPGNDLQRQDDTTTARRQQKNTASHFIYSAKNWRNDCDQYSPFSALSTIFSMPCNDFSSMLIWLSCHADASALAIKSSRATGHG